MPLSSSASSSSNDSSSLYDDVVNLPDDGLDRFISPHSYAYSSPLRLSRNNEYASIGGQIVRQREEVREEDRDEGETQSSALSSSAAASSSSSASPTASSSSSGTVHHGRSSYSTPQEGTSSVDDPSTRGLYYQLMDTEILGIHPRHSANHSAQFSSSHSFGGSMAGRSGRYSRNGWYGRGGGGGGRVDILASEVNIMDLECNLSSSSQLRNSSASFGDGGIEAGGGGILIEKRKHHCLQSVLGFSSPSPYNWKNDTHSVSARINRYSNDPYAVSPISLSSLSVANGLSFQDNSRKHARKICKSAFKVLDAPNLVDDFYLNLVDWSATNVLAVGLSSAVYLWSTCTSKVTKLLDVGDDGSGMEGSNNRRNQSNEQITSVAWSQRGSHIAVGMKSGCIEIWDAEKLKRVRKLENSHTMRVGTLAWNACILSSGSRDQSITNHDVREPNPHVCKWQSHKQEVCGLKWSPSEQQLASGGNDNKLVVWQLGSCTPLLQFKEHTAAIKALAWSPHKSGLLASGGGTADRCIRFYDTLCNLSLKKIDTGSQVCNLAWSKNINELVSTHGYSLNQVIIWKCPSMQKLSTLIGHTYRVLYLAVSPDGQTIVTGAGDETLRFWNVFPPSKSNYNFNNQQLRFTNVSIVR